MATNFAPSSELTVASFGDATAYSEHLTAGAAVTTSNVVGAATYLPYDGSGYVPPPVTTTTTTTGGGGTPPVVGCGQAISGEPQVVQNPTSEDVPVGGTASFTALASSSPAASVQWQVSVDQGATYQNIANATSTTLTFPVTQSESGGFYRAEFTNVYATDFSSAASLTVGGAPDVTTEPQSQGVANGATVTFTAAATGDPTPTIQWEGSTDGGTTWLPLADATSNTLTFTATTAESGTEYRAIFNNSVGSALTSVAELIVGPFTAC
jgi:hypothetical protein